MRSVRSPSALLLVVIAFILAREMKPLLIGESASETDLVKINGALSTSTNVISIIHLRTMHLGPDDLLLAAKIDFDHSLSVEELAHAIDQAELAVRDRGPEDHDDLHRTRHPQAAVHVTVPALRG